MAFADELREAGLSKGAVLQEFLIQHDPKEERIHAFVEGYEDPVYYRSKLHEFTRGRPTFFYTCGGKRRLEEVFRDVVARVGSYRHTLYFRDKDLDDIIPETFLRDDRVCVTRFYSIENYLVTRSVVEYICNNFLRVKKCYLPLEKVADRFELEQARFYRLLTPVMAWIICVRRCGERPNLNNVNLAEIFHVDECLHTTRLPLVITYLCRAAGVPHDTRLWRDLRVVMRGLKGLPPKSFVRGKFDVWFLVEFLRGAVAQLEAAAAECHGSVEVTVRLEKKNAVTLVAPLVPVPPGLREFLERHLEPG